MFNWRQPKNFRAFAYSTQGAREGENEDNYLIIQNQQEKITAEYLKDQQREIIEPRQWDGQKIRIAVADGMGGHQHGREAAEQLISALIKIPATGHVSQLAGHIKNIHKNLLERLDGSGKNRPGSTLVVADIDCETGLCVIASVGDSRAYLLREGHLHQLSHDHVYCEFAWRDDDLKDDEYFTSRHKVADLTQAMGYGSHGIIPDADGTRPYRYDPNLRLDFKDDRQNWQYDWDKSRRQHRDVFLLHMEAEDVLLLSTDGLWSTGEDSRWLPEITAPLTNSAALEKLAQAAVDAGSRDNVTLVMCAREGAIGGYGTIDGKAEQVYQESKNIAETLHKRFVIPALSALKNVDFKYLKLSAFLCLLVAFWSLAAYRIMELQRQAGIATPTGTNSEDQQLFEDLKKSELMAMDEQLRLLLKPSDYDLAQKAKGQPLAEKEAALLKSLYAGKAGHIVREQISQWNQTREFSAIRDTGHDWQAWDPYGVKLSTGGAVPDAFGFVHQSQLDEYVYGALRTEFKDWTVIRHGDIAIYQREIPAGEVVKSQYIGHLVDCRLLVSGQPDRDCNKDPKKGPKKDPELRPLCEIKGIISPRNPSCKLESAKAGEITINNLPAKAVIKLSLKPVANPDNQANGLAISYEEDNKKPTKDLFVYHFEKALSKPLQEEKKSRFTIETADKIKLTDDFGVLKEGATPLGLTGLIGVDKNDYNRLSYLMAESGFNDGYRLMLTLDGRMQQAANTALKAGVDDESRRQEKDAYKNVRRASLVILDADNGDILAASSFPQPPAKVNPWDKAAFSKRYWSLDPFLNRGWEGGDKNQAPGSTFNRHSAPLLLGISI
jgi:serine/threonine protein phosphatase PrpC